MTDYRVVPDALRLNVRFLYDAADAWASARKALDGKELRPDDLGKLGQIEGVTKNHNEALDTILDTLREGVRVLEQPATLSTRSPRPTRPRTPSTTRSSGTWPDLAVGITDNESKGATTMTMTFPEQEAQIIVKWAREAGEDAVVWWIDKIRDWLGHPEVIMDRASTWGVDAKNSIDDAEESIVVCRGELAAYWEGSAYDSFSIYMDSLTTVFDQAEDVMSGMGELMLAAREEVTKVFQAAVGFIGDTAADILDAVGGAIEQAIRAWLSILSAVIKILADFIRNVTALEQEAMGVIDGLGSLGLELKMKATDLEVPSTMPPSAGISDNWDVRAQT